MQCPEDLPPLDSSWSNPLHRLIVELGRRHRPFYRLTVMDTHKPRDGRAIEELGFYDPITTETDKQLKLKEDRIRYWLDQGAQTSDTVRSLLRKRGIAVKAK